MEAGARGRHGLSFRVGVRHRRKLQSEVLKPRSESMTKKTSMGTVRYDPQKPEKHVDCQHLSHGLSAHDSLLLRPFHCT